jgi:non-specific serine/threonine protein kinase
MNAGDEPHEIARRLTPRQREIACLLAEGRTPREIATLLSVSEHTVHEHIRHIYEQTGHHNRAALVAAVVRSGMCEQK